jgi:hypothetical protein
VPSRPNPVLTAPTSFAGRNAAITITRPTPIAPHRMGAR